MECCCISRILHSFDKKTEVRFSMSFVLCRNGLPLLRHACDEHCFNDKHCFACKNFSHRRGLKTISKV